MPYIGNTAGNRFVASKAASVYSGDGSTTAFTLEHAVGSDEDILVSVDGVIQEPSVAYAVSSGTTLTFTAAPSSNSGNNIFVYYLFRTVATVDHPSTSSLQATDGTFSAGVTATSGTFTGAFTSLGIDDNASSTAMTVSTGGFTLSPATSNLYQTNGALSYYGTTNNVYLIGAGSGGGLLLGGDSTRAEYIYISASNNNIQFTTGSALGMLIDSNGHVTMPKQPIFIATAESTISLSTSFAELTAFSTAQVNIGTHYNTSNGRFTAPVAGTYQFAVASIGGQNSTVYRYRIYKNGNSLHNYSYRIDNNQGSNLEYGTNGEFCIVATLAASDYISIFAKSDDGSDAYASSSYRYSYFRGHLMG